MFKVQIKSKKYKSNEILKDLNFQLSSLNSLALVGPSGCGKTTLLGILAKLDKDFEGEIDFQVEKISYIFQDDRLIPWLSVKENLLLVSKNKDLDEILELLELVCLKDVLDEYPNNLSGGMKKRIAFIRAFIGKPELILMDEAFTSLDFPTAQNLKKEFLKLCEKYKTKVVLVTHDLSEAIELCEKIVFLSNKPTRVIYEYENKNAKNLSLKEIDSIKNEILDEHINILKGEI